MCVWGSFVNNDLDLSNIEVYGFDYDVSLQGKKESCICSFNMSI